MKLNELERPTDTQRMGVRARGVAWNSRLEGHVSIKVAIGVRSTWKICHRLLPAPCNRAQCFLSGQTQGFLPLLSLPQFLLQRQCPAISSISPSKLPFHVEFSQSHYLHNLLPRMLADKQVALSKLGWSHAFVCSPLKCIFSS